MHDISEIFSLSQSVTEPTLQQGHLLDLAFYRYNNNYNNTSNNESNNNKTNNNTTTTGVYLCVHVPMCPRPQLICPNNVDIVYPDGTPMAATLYTWFFPGLTGPASSGPDLAFVVRGTPEALTN